MAHWLESINLPFKRCLTDHLRNDLTFLAQEERFPTDVIIHCSENGSGEQQNIHHFNEHFNRFVRTVVPQDVPIVLTIDIHSSRGFL